MTNDEQRVTAPTSAPRPATIAGVLLLAIAGISIAAPLIRLSDAHPLAIATWRLLYAMLFVIPALLLGGGWRQYATLTRKELGLALFAGVMLAAHFWTWNASVDLTSVAASTVLVNLQPVVVALLSAWWLHERPERGQWLGIAIAMVGAMVLVIPDLRGGAIAEGRNPLLGDALAIAGGVTAALYYLIGRRLRQKLDLWPYAALVYGACLVSLVVMVLAARVPLGGYAANEHGIFIALAIGPMLLGHTGMNWALKHLPAYVVNLTVLGEPVGATLIAALLPGIRELPGPFVLLGGALILGGILVAGRRAPHSE